MSIIRAPRPDAGFVQIRNEVARDGRLSYKARGILLEILSRPDNWQTSADQLARGGKDGRTSVLSGLAELRSAGYLHTVKSRNEDGTFATINYVFDSPRLAPESDEPESGFPTSDYPTSIEHSSKNTDQETLVPDGTSAAPTESVNQQANRLAKVYVDLVPLSNFPAVAMVVRKAIRAGYPEREITDALIRMGHDGRSVTTDALRYEIDGLPTSRRQAPANLYLSAAHDLADPFAEPRAIGSAS